MKRVLSLVLSAVFLLGCVYLPAFAVDTDAASTSAFVPVSWSEPVDTKINGGYPRIITAGNGSLLMAYSAGTKLYVARSSDNGNTWPAKKVAYNFVDTGISAANPTPYYDVETKTLYLAFRAPTSDGVSPYTASIRYVTSTDNGDTWSEPYTVVSSTVSDESVYGGMWEPTIYRIGGKLRIFYSCDTVKETSDQVKLNVGTASQSSDTTFPFVESKAYQNIVMHTLDEATGVWSGASCSIDGQYYDPYKSYSWSNYHASRPGMQSVSQLSDGTYVMTVENNKYHFADKFNQTRYPFVIDMYFSEDGLSWSDPVTVARSPKAEYYCAAPWVDTLPDGRIIVSFQTDEHRPEPLADNTSSHTKHQMKVIVSKEPITYSGRAGVSASSFESYRPLDAFNSDVTYNAWNAVYVDGYKVYAYGKITTNDAETTASRGISIATFDSAPDAESIPAGYKPIYTADDMLRLMHQEDGFMWAGKYILMADIDMADATLKLPQQQIGYINKSASYFSGTFDGNGHSIRGIDITTGEQWAGLFGYSLNSTIKNFTLYGRITATYDKATARAGGACGVIGHINGKSSVSNITNYAEITAVGSAGGIVGYAFRNGTTAGSVKIENCTNYASVSSTPATNDAAATGGIVGVATTNTYDIEITGCVNYGYISGRRYVGGIVGACGHESTNATYTRISNCVNDAPVTVKTTDIGGILGLGWYTVITDCLNRAEVQNTRTGSGGTQSGGIVGRTHLATTVTNCVNAAVVYSRGGSICGQLGTDAATSLTNCYYSEKYATDVTTLGTMLRQGAAALPSSYVGLDFETTWRMTGGMPALRIVSGYKYSDAQYTELSTPEDILELMNADGPFTGKYVLKCDIDLSKYTGELTQRPIGLEVATAFKGTFEGNGYTISGIDITYEGKAGFFGYGINATVRNLNLRGSVNSTSAYTALMFGVVNGSVQIDNSSVAGEVNGADSTGGIVGFALLNSGSDNFLRISGSTNYASIKTANAKAGGIVGYVQHQKAGATTVISDCINRGDITSSMSGQAYAAGIVGLARNCNNNKDVFGDGLSIIGCSNFGNITATAGQRIAGIIPAVLDDKESECRVSNCANFGRIYAEGKGENTRTDVGGVVAVAINLNVDACVNYGWVEVGSGKICASVVGRLYNYSNYAPAEIRNCYDLSGQGLEVVGDPDGMVCDNYKLTYCKTFTQNIHLPEKYQGFETVLWEFGERGAYLAGSHTECSYNYKLTLAPTYTSEGEYVYWCAICGKIESSGSIDKLALVYGDVNADGEFNNSDLTMLVRVLAGWQEEYLAPNADPNGDGRISNRDAIVLIRKLAGYN